MNANGLRMADNLKKAFEYISMKNPEKTNHLNFMFVGKISTLFDVDEKKLRAIFANSTIPCYKIGRPLGRLMKSIFCSCGESSSMQQQQAFSMPKKIK